MSFPILEGDADDNRYYAWLRSPSRRRPKRFKGRAVPV